MVAIPDQSGNKFAYAYFRDELKAQPDCNPDINIMMKDKDSNNPYQRKITEANDKYLGIGHIVVVVTTQAIKKSGIKIILWT